MDFVKLAKELLAKFEEVCTKFKLLVRPGFIECT